MAREYHQANHIDRPHAGFFWRFSGLPEWLKTLADKHMAPEMQYLELEEERIEQQQTLAAEQSRQQQFAALQSIDQQIQALDAELHGQTLADIQEQQRQRDTIIQELHKAKDLNAKQILYAPVAVAVQQLMVNTLGGVVTPAQELMVIVPKEQSLCSSFRRMPESREVR